MKMRYQGKENTIKNMLGQEVRLVPEQACDVILSLVSENNLSYEAYVLYDENKKLVCKLDYLNYESFEQEWTPLYCGNGDLDAPLDYLNRCLDNPNPDCEK